MRSAWLMVLMTTVASGVAGAEEPVPEGARASDAPASDAPASEPPADAPAPLPGRFGALDVESRIQGLDRKIQARLAGEPEPEPIEAAALADALTEKAAATEDPDRKLTLQALAARVGGLDGDQKLDLDGVVEELVGVVAPGMKGKRAVKKAGGVVADVLPVLQDLLGGGKGR